MDEKNQNETPKESEMDPDVSKGPDPKIEALKEEPKSEINEPMKETESEEKIPSEQTDEQATTSEQESTESSEVKPDKASTTPKDPKKKKTLWYIVGGCSGCFVLIVIVFLVLYFVIGGTIRKSIDNAVSGEEQAQDAISGINEEIKKAQEEADKVKEEAEKAKEEAEKKAEEIASVVTASGQTGITDNVGNFTTKKTYAADVDNVSVEVTPKNAKPTDKITVELYDPNDKIIDKETKTVGSSATLDFIFVMQAEMTPGTHEFKVLSGGEELDSGTFTVEAPISQQNQPTKSTNVPESLDPTTFWYKDYFVWSDEFIKDWKTLDIDGDGYMEGCILAQRGSQDEYHVFILDWDDSIGEYVVAYDETYKYPTTRIMLKDWNGDNQQDFVLVHTENSGDASAIVYTNGRYDMTDSGL